MDELEKFGHIHSVNSFFDFKLSIKTIILLFFSWIALCVVVFIIIMGGINNAIEYIMTMAESTKQTIIKIKKKNQEVQPSKNIVQPTKDIDQ